MRTDHCSILQFHCDTKFWVLQLSSGRLVFWVTSAKPTSAFNVLEAVLRVVPSRTELCLS